MRTNDVVKTAPMLRHSPITVGCEVGAFSYTHLPQGPYGEREFN